MNGTRGGRGARGRCSRDADLYLAEVKRRLSRTPQPVREPLLEDLRDAIAGSGLTDLEAIERRFGSPSQIAADVSESAGAEDDGRHPVMSARAIYAPLVLGLGSFVVPVAGWVIGAVLVARTAAWSRSERVIAIFIPLVVGVGYGLATWFATPKSAAATVGPSVAMYLPRTVFLTSALVALDVTSVVAAAGLLVLAVVRRRRIGRKDLSTDA